MDTRLPVRIASGVLLVLAAAAQSALPAAGTQTYQYDALGRLKRVDFPDGRFTVYTYDAVGNRRTSGSAPTIGTGTFAFVSGVHTNKGSSGDIATATIRNAGTQTLTGIVRTCPTGSSWVPWGSPPSSLAPGATGTYQCSAMSSGASNITMTFGGAGASNAPYTTPAW
jgi:YD repeat-containing protein